MRRHALLSVLAIAASACVPARVMDVVQAADASRSSLDSAVDVPTTSFALDRIAKRSPTLSGSTRRRALGRGVAIYVFDGGIVDHHEFAGRLRFGFDAFPGQRVCNPHGTAVAGAAAGTTTGVAPAAEIVDVKIINCAGAEGTPEAILAAAVWTVSDHRQRPWQRAVANWSFTVDSNHHVPLVDSAARLLRAAGIVVVASAGNVDIDACRMSPANAGVSLVVGATSLVRHTGSRRVDVRTPGTAWGPCIDVYAPGDSVVLPAPGRPGTTMVWSGTSMAAGYVSGAASVLLEQWPGSTPDTIANLVRRHATAHVVDERVRARATPVANGRMLYVGFD